ncbi:MAG: hypothetical protein V1913_02685 [Fibrobacterota bacterium]
MIRINLLSPRSLSRRKRLPVVSFHLPVKKILLLLVLLTAGYAAWTVTRYVRSQKPAVIMAPHREVTVKETTTPFDVVEDIVEDIHGGRFKVRMLNRLSSPAHLSVNEKKLYERFFIKNTFDLFNASVRSGMGFNTITLDNIGNFFIYGTTPSETEAREFQSELKRADGILQADELDFKKKFMEAKTSFALKGFLNYNILEQFYDDDSWKREESYRESKEAVLYDMTQLGKAYGLQFTRAAEWGSFDVYGVARRHTVRLQLTATYAGFMKWLSALYERNFQIGYSKVNLTSIGGQKILIAIECYVYAKN